MFGQTISNVYDRLLFKSLRAMFYLWKRRNSNNFNPRMWSNDELRKISGLLKGDIINVSAGRDKDKEGSEYREYFPNSNSYTISNLYRSTDDEEEIIIDLRVPIDVDQLPKPQYDVVMTHTVLEHVVEMDTAVDNLCRLSRDIIVSIVPFIQSFHHKENEFCDYWRFTPFAMKRMFESKGFDTVYVNWNNDPLGNIYIFHVCSKDPEKWRPLFAREWPEKIQGPGYNRNMLVENLNVCRNVLITRSRNKDLF